MSDVKRRYKGRYIMVKPIKSTNSSPYKDTRSVNKDSDESKYKGQWYIIKEKKINVYKDLNVRLV